jgi:methylenetetrahydrofolate dehydrogenase (NADP+)/methenyltetrahydrofolate cyclohydrolase
MEDDLGGLVDFDVVVSATGERGIIKGSMIKKGVSLIDVGYPEGDVDEESVGSKASFLCPSGGGVGPLTISYLMENTLKSAQRRAYEHEGKIS